jgi:hypothetical protein
MSDLNKKGLLRMEEEVEGFKFAFDMQLNAPLGLAYDFAHKVLMEIIELSKDAAEKAKRTEDKKEEAKEN